MGARTDHFLLEKSRLVHVDPDERNYHVFYEMLRGLPADTLEVRVVLVPSAGLDGYHDWTRPRPRTSNPPPFRQTTDSLTTRSRTPQELKLTGAPEDYAILAQGGCCSLEDVDDAEEFGHVCEALATLGLRSVRRGLMRASAREDGWGWSIDRC